MEEMVAQAPDGGRLGFHETCKRLSEWTGRRVVVAVRPEYGDFITVATFAGVMEAVDLWREPDSDIAYLFRVGGPDHGFILDQFRFQGGYVHDAIAHVHLVLDSCQISVVLLPDGESTCECCDLMDERPGHDALIDLVRVVGPARDA